MRKNTLIRIISAAAVSAALLTSCSQTENDISHVSDEESAVSYAESSEEQSVPEQSDTASGEESVMPEIIYTDGAKLVVFGDSITALGTWGEQTADDLNMYFFNGALGGMTTSEALDRFGAYVANRDPDFVTISFGMNDLLMTAVDKPKVSVEQFKKNLAKMVDDVTALGAVPILMTTNPLVNEVFFASQGQDSSLYANVGTPLEWLDVYNEATRAVAAEKGCALVDTRKAFEQYSPASVDNPDGIHLNATGNKVFAETLEAWFNENYERDPDAGKVVRNNYVDVTEGSERIISFEAGDWYTPKASEMIFKGGDSLKMSNTTGLWPDAHYQPEIPYSVLPDNAFLHVSLSTSASNASIVLYMNGATPSAYSEGKYIVLNSYLGVNTDSYTGDILSNQSCDIMVPLSGIAFPSGCFNSDGKLVFSGVKIYVAGTAYSPVTIKAFDLVIKED